MGSNLQAITRQPEPASGSVDSAAARVLLAGIRDPEFERLLTRGGYGVVTIADPSRSAEVDVPVAAMVIGQTAMSILGPGGTERLYFQNETVPIAVLIDDPENIEPSLMDALRHGTIEALWQSEVSTGLALRRIDRLVIVDRLDRSLRKLQRTLSEKELLEKELSIREQTLTRERGINANIIASITSGMAILDTEGTILLVNEHIPRLLPAADDIMGAPYASAFPPEVCAIVERVRGDGELNPPTSSIGKCKIGDSYLEVSAYRMLDYQNRPTGTLILIQDVTEHENMNMQLYRTEKLATVGTMLSGIAHELRNPLSIISARARRALAKRSSDPAWVEKTFASIEAQTERCASIVNSLLDFTRNTATTPGFHAVADIIDETLTYVEYQNAFDNIKVEKNYSPDVHVFGDRSRYVQVFLNIITNAADAMGGAGTLCVTTETVGILSALIKVSDTGPGIPAEIQKHIFDPFFTTKEPGKGTGLGMAIVHKIVQESGGRIWFTSAPGRTTFFVMLPSVKGRTHEAAHPAGRR